jgi:hypothetical protein
VELKAESPENVSATQGLGPIIDQFTKDEWILPDKPADATKNAFQFLQWHNFTPCARSGGYLAVTGITADAGIGCAATAVRPDAADVCAGKFQGGG